MFAQCGAPTHRHLLCLTVQTSTAGSNLSSRVSSGVLRLPSTLNHSNKPLTMTADKKKHLGFVFFSFPDGSGMLYSLQGTAEPPKPEDTIPHELPAKTYQTQMIPVHNWLSKQQRFCVLMEILNPDKTDATVSLSGFEYIDVPSLSKRDYKMCFYTYKEGQFNTKVMFQNRTSGEYLFYLVSFKVTSPGVISSIELETAVRWMILATVQVENPLTTTGVPQY
ncbi:hydrocephalus-inducing protein homolog [Xyrichtys novacula]|uniref:Hydrocephalus-inducing protein homolog n=1 Tax=Xyrichtys novacula TaxID=13765 RepID=A0AAV1FA47_XYRNO|nr:hydrocephalus-inducing protein homolog [Xyrichtys novacula]